MVILILDNYTNILHFVGGICYCLLIMKCLYLVVFIIKWDVTKNIDLKYNCWRSYVDYKYEQNIKLVFVLN